MLAIVIMPMTAFNPSFPIVALLGSVVAALLNQGTGRHDNYARIILATAFVMAPRPATLGGFRRNPWSMVTSYTPGNHLGRLS